MKLIVLTGILLCSLQLVAQTDIDVVYLCSGERIECTIQSVWGDSLHISRFSGKHKVVEGYAMNEVAVYLVNNFYTTPAEDILRASGHFYTGTSFMIVGGIVTSLAVNEGKTDLAVIGSSIGLVGTIFLYSGFSKINKAARKMNKLQLQNDRIIYKL
jgi:hypothetical protein